MRAIVVVDEKWGIGKDGGLLVHIPGDLKQFKEKTKGNVVVMGRKTLESLPGGKPLTERTNIILSRKENFDWGCLAVHSTEELHRELQAYPEERIFSAGGEEIYKQMLPYCNTCFVTKIFNSFKADCFFENLDENNEFSIVHESDVQEENGVRYQFIEYRRI